MNFSINSCIIIFLKGLPMILDVNFKYNIFFLNWKLYFRLQLSPEYSGKNCLEIVLNPLFKVSLKNPLKFVYLHFYIKHTCSINIENRIYREELKESLGMNFVSPFQPEREFKVYKSCKCSQIICSRVH